jgi:peptidoglycan/xylan/chitin deacetylase (PgdA/CDA1 family)
VSPEHFAEHLSVLEQVATPVRLSDLVQAAADHVLPRRAVAITFDDGYVDNLYAAKPLLERFEIPATVFVSSGHVDSHTEFWWDELERIIFTPGRLPAELTLSVDQDELTWAYAPERCPSDIRRPTAVWHLGEPEISSRQLLYRLMYTQLRGLPNQTKQSVLSRLRVWSGIGQEVRPSHRTLTTPEVVALADGGLIEVGAHSVSHSALAQVALEGQWYEISGCRTHLEAIVGRPVLSFSYPHGSRTPTTDRMVREAGYLRACTSRTAMVRAGTDAFSLPRVEMRDEGKVAFARRLQSWVG